MADWTARAVTADEVIAVVGSGMRLFVHGAAAAPTPLLEALVRRPGVRDITLSHLHTNGPAPFVEPEHRPRFFSVSVFTGPPLRRAIEEGAADFVPIFLSDIPALFLSRKVALDVALLQLSPPDAHGYCTLGTSVDAALAASLSARYIVAEINERMPRTLGNTLVPFARVHAFTRTDRPLYEHRPEPPAPVPDAIGKHIAAFVEDGAHAADGHRRDSRRRAAAARRQARSRRTHRDVLRWHRRSRRGGRHHQPPQARPPWPHRHQLRGGQRAIVPLRARQPVRRVPSVRSHQRHVADTQERQSRGHQFGAGVDLSGQVVADSIGFRVFSGIGGQMDFIRGAALSPGGKPIIGRRRPPPAAAHRASSCP